METDPDGAYFQVSVTAPSRDEAASLGRMAVERRLAAGAQVSGPLSSTYWWEGEVMSAPEYLCVLKTRSGRLPALIEAVKEAHSYEVPEIVALPIVAAGDSAYLAWIEGETRGDVAKRGREVTKSSASASTRSRRDSVPGMPMYLMLSTLGPDGMATLRENPQRLKAVNTEVETMGVRVVSQWALLGPYDFATILEAPDEKVVALVALTLGARGTLKTKTLTAIPIDEFIDAVSES